MTHPTRAALRIALIYAAIAGFWILLTDHMLMSFFERATSGVPPRLWQTVKGLFFVAVTSVLLYAALARYFGRLVSTTDAYRASEHRWERLLNQTPEPVLIFDDEDVVYANQAAVEALGADDRSDIVGRSTSEFAWEDAEEMSIDWLPRRVGDHTASLGFVTDLAGRRRCIEATSSSISFQGRVCRLSVWRDVTDRQRFEEHLVAAKNEAENASRMKSTILANLSHEIRTPLTAIIGYTEVLHGDPDAPVRESIDLIHRSALRLKETLESILTLAELEAGGAAFRVEATDIRDVVRSTAEIFTGQARRNGLSFDVAVPAVPVEACVDARALAQIVMNLVSNAVKFTHEGGIRVAVRDAGDHVEVEVQDTGIGIKEGFRARIFDEFVQVSQGLDREYEGSGLGLTIVRQLTELHDGTVRVESREGAGTRFVVELPKSDGWASARHD